jgi:hypothetical protein
MANTPQNPNGPPVQACEIIATAVNTEAKILQTWKDILDAIAKIRKIKWSILYGVLDIADVVGTETFSAFSIVASSVANAILKGISGAISSLLEAILSQLLSILLSFPNALFSLVAIPLERAVDSANKEKYYIIKARKDLQYVNSIMAKWIKNIDGSHYYRQMLTAMPYLEKILNLIQQMLSELQVNWQNIDSSNAYFDQSKYTTLRKLLRQAIAITQPMPNIDENAQYTQSITAALTEQKQNHIASIDAKYRDRKKAIDTNFMNQLIKANASSQTVGDHIKISLININWANQIKQMQADKKAEISLAEADINYKQLLSISFASHQGNLYDSFRSDMNLMGNYLADFLDNLTGAYKQNLQCQNFCLTVYNSRTLIHNLVKYILTLLRSTGNVSSLIATEALDGAETLVTTAKNLFQEKIKEYEDTATSYYKTSSAVMSVSLSSGNILLETADATLNGLITDSLIQLINADTTLTDNTGQFDAFLKKLSEIPDWNKKTGSWILNLVGGVTLNPYIQLIADATEMVSMMPILALANKPRAAQALAGIVNNVDRGFRKILQHNAMVINVVTSYTPYQSSECGNLKRLLSQAGLLDAFATGLNFASVVNSFVSMTDLNPSNLEPNLKNCRSYYPDLFTDVDAVSLAFEDEANKLPPAANISVIQPKYESFNPFPNLAASRAEIRYQDEDLLKRLSTKSAYGIKP